MLTCLHKAPMIYLSSSRCAREDLETFRALETSR